MRTKLRVGLHDADEGKFRTGHASNDMYARWVCAALAVSSDDLFHNFVDRNGLQRICELDLGQKVASLPDSRRLRLRHSRTHLKNSDMLLPLHATAVFACCFCMLLLLLHADAAAAAFACCFACCLCMLLLLLLLCMLLLPWHAAAFACAVAIARAAAFACS